MKIALSHVCMSRGGSESRAMWGLAALVEAGYDVTLLTAGHVDLDGLNAWYGTSLQPGDFKVRQAPVLPGMRHSRRAAAVRGTMFQSFCRQVAGEYDACVSAYNLCDFGVPAVHFIADFCWDRQLQQSWNPAPDEGSSVLHREGLLRSAYLKFASLWRNPSGRDLFAGEDVLVANSKWTADLMRKRYGQADLQVVYPPVQSEFQQQPWEQRETGFVCLGRVAPEKRIEQIIAILDKVRQRGHDVHLHIIGPIGDDPYGQMVRRLVQTHRAWVIAEGQQVGPAKESLLAGHRFALHACVGEAFGIAVAEQVKAGCIPFVPAEGGPAEIVDEPTLCYTAVEQAVEQIDQVLRDETEQQRLRTHLAKRAGLFGIEAFKREFVAVVERFMQQRKAE